MTTNKEESLGQPALSCHCPTHIFVLKSYNKNECSLTIVKCLYYCIFSFISLESVTTEGQSEEPLSIIHQFELLLFFNQRSLKNAYFTKVNMLSVC